MKIILCAYPPDWSLKETIALPVFLDQVPTKGDTGRIDFRLRGLISGLAQEGLFEGNGDWLLIDENRKLAPQILLAPLPASKNLSLAQVSQWLKKVCWKLSQAGVRHCSLGISNLFRENFPLKEFSEAIIKALLFQSEDSERLEIVKLYVGLELAEVLAQEMARWVAHLKPEIPVELEIDLLPTFLGEQL